MRIAIAASTALVAVTFGVGTANAADDDTKTGVVSESPGTAGAATPTTPTDSRIDALEKKMAELQEENKTLASQLSDLQESQNQGSVEPPSDIGKTKIFGFFDMSFGKFYYSRKDSALKANMPFGEHSSFMLSALNVYLGNQITEKLKFLSELRFTFQPLGNETSVQGFYAAPNGSKSSLGTQYTRTDTTIAATGTAEVFNLGGVGIERVQATYSFNDYIKVTVGRFLTPYGIWNVDHGSPVILTARTPLMQTRQLIPTRQLGVQLFGRAYLSEGWSVDYAATVSNGRGPMDSVIDLDENKGIGLRWRLNFERDELSVSLGQYGYTGKYTDISKSITLGPGSADYSVAVDTVNQYTEYDLANDLLVTFHGLRLQSELLVKKVVYQVPPRLTASNFNGSPLVASQYYAANNWAAGGYGLLGYELPQAWTTKKIRVTPFVYYERVNFNDTSDNNSGIHLYSAGINIKPYPGIVLKLEYDRMTFGDLVNQMPDGTTQKQNNGNLQLIMSQVAVTY